MNLDVSARATAGNLLEAVPAAMHEELVETLASRSNLRIERIVSFGQASAPGTWYDQPWAEWVLLVQGQAAVLLESDGLRHLRSGDWLILPPHCRHRVEWTSSDPPAIWVAVHFRDS